MSRALNPLLGLAGLLVFSSAALSQAAPVYHAEFLGSASQPVAVNESGLVVGTGKLGLYPRAFVAGPGQPVAYLPIPFGLLSSAARDVNEAGVIVGVVSPYSTTNVIRYPAQWVPDGAGGYSATIFELLPGHNRGSADAINNLGDIVGSSSYQTDIHTVLFTTAGTVDLPGLGGYRPWALNDQRVYVSPSSGAVRVDLDTLAVQNLGFPPGSTGAEGWAINGSGQVAGHLLLDGGPSCTMQPALYTDGPGWATVGDCGTSSSVYDLNDQGDVLLSVANEPYVRFAGGGLHRVEDLIVADVGHWTVFGGYDIALNGARQMAFYASNAGTGQTGIILITPEAGVTCQADLGFGGPGSMQLSICGGDLSSGTSADLLLTGCVPGGTAWMLAGLTQQPTPFKGGLLVPVPWALMLALPVNGAGQVAVNNIPGGHGPLSVYVQALMLDALQPNGWALSNALRVDLLP
ncbi:MAG TPA: hypothetical protein VFD43_12865 [Planctomycetota bacterium]|nr:hypothetical protein [Planctomycetota bacterium]